LQLYVPILLAGAGEVLSSSLSVPCFHEHLGAEDYAAFQPC
jgi:hypothetical protein